MNRPRKSQVAEDKEVISDHPKLRVRDRIMRTASDLFYCRGIRAVGVDTIATEAGTNKMSFYRSFASKDELVAEYLRGEERQGWRWWDETVAAHTGDPRAQVEALFEVLVTKACKEG
jgi:AcrR family transcriptional regulator